MSSQWSKYNNLIIEHYKHGEKNFIKLAKRILNQEKLTYEVDLLRVYAKRYIEKNGLKQDGKKAKVLIFDTETSHIIARVWGLWKQNINHTDIIKDWHLLCWSAKWLFEDEVYNMSLTPKEVAEGNDKRISIGLWNMFDEADVIIAHNLKKFDRKVAQTRFIKNDLNLPSPYNEIDTLLHARKQFKISSNRLDYLGEFLQIGRKIETEKGLWNKVEAGDAEAMDRMVTYCDQDVRLLEDVYLELRPYIQPHPNIGLFIEKTFDKVCPSCGGTHLEYIGDYATTVNTYDAYRCSDCNSVTRARKVNTPAGTNNHITSSVPK